MESRYCNTGRIPSNYFLRFSPRQIKDFLYFTFARLSPRKSNYVPQPVGRIRTFFLDLRCSNYKLKSPSNEKDIMVISLRICIASVTICGIFW